MTDNHPTAITSVPEPNRRALVSWAFAAPIAASIPTARAHAGPRVPDDWREFIREMADLHPAGATVAIQAYLQGASLDTLIAVRVNGPKLATGPYPLLMFRTADGWLTIQPHQVWEYHRVERGSGPPIDLAAHGIKTGLPDGLGA